MEPFTILRFHLCIADLVGGELKTLNSAYKNLMGQSFTGKRALLQCEFPNDNRICILVFCMESDVISTKLLNFSRFVKKENL